jgi:Icc-related predicted phosphoesterase
MIALHQRSAACIARSISRRTDKNIKGLQINVKILALADTHGFLPELETKNIDIVAVAGDICPMHSHRPAFQKRWLETVFYKWAANLKKPVYLCLGNHDFVDGFHAPPNLFCHTEKVLGDILLFSYTPKFGDGAWLADEQSIENKLAALLKTGRPSVWITHGPPYGACDGIPQFSPGLADFPRADFWRREQASAKIPVQHAGSAALRKAVEKYAPKAVICGHIHTGRGRVKINGAAVYNVAWSGDVPFLDEDGGHPGATLIEA